MADAVVPLLDQSGEWTHRERHQHHRFEIQVPENTTGLWLRFRWEPLDLGSEQLGNGVTLSVFGPEGFRGAASRSSADLGLTIRDTDAPPGFLDGPLSAGTWTLVLSAGEILN